MVGPDKEQKYAMLEVHAPTARDVLGEKLLYKFRSVADEVQKQRLRDIILGHRIRFARPSELNDPLEGKPVYALGDWSSEPYRQRFADWAWQTQKHIKSPPPQYAFRAWVLAQSAAFHERQVASINEANQREIEDKWRILSLSAIGTSDLMWAHYADSHKGVVLVFDASYGEFALAYRVSYTPERVPLDITNNDLTEVLHATILTKRDIWAYEQEYRSVAPEVWEPDTLRLRDQFLHFSPAQLVGIIFGAKTSPGNEAEIVSWSAQRECAVQFSKAKINVVGSVELA